jgi:hypothetical protein
MTSNFLLIGEEFLMPDFTEHKRIMSFPRKKLEYPTLFTRDTGYESLMKQAKTLIGTSTRMPRVKFLQFYGEVFGLQSTSMAPCQLAVKKLLGYSTCVVVVKPLRETISLHKVIDHCMGKDLPRLEGQF